ncbi:hypothetical protein ABLB84_03850 [Xenorhabdus szentirmaii]|uniref:hypothetical protein n=1 Tax=Xenorhabdus szentirmaii TaxID=290112 RepID=UPI0032B79A7F
MFTEQDMVDINKLISLLKQVIIYLQESGCGELSYKGLNKSINILENKAINGMGNIYFHIMGDFRMMADRGQYGEEHIDTLMTEIYHIIMNNLLFRNQRGKTK